MRLEELHTNLKILNSNNVEVMQLGSFYKTFGNDVLVLWKIFDYKIHSVVISKLNRADISVIINNFDGTVYYETALDNVYNECLEKL